MALNTLNDDIRKICAALDEIRIDLENGVFTDESKVSGGIVRKLLNALDWPVFDIKVVIPEYPVEKRQVDFALCDPPFKPRVLIEAKQVGNINASGEKQLFEYAFHEGVPILILTDGKEWHFFHTSGTGVYKERRVDKLDLEELDTEANAARLYRYLKYESICNGIAIQAITEDYQKIFKRRLITNTLPKAWSNLLGQNPNESMLVVELAEETKNICGEEPTGEVVLDFLKCLESKQPANPLPSHEPSSLNRKKKPTTRLVVTMPNGEKIDHPNARQTFFEVIEKLGVERVKNCNPELIFASEQKDVKTWKSGQYYILVGGIVGAVKAKKKKLDRIATTLGLRLQVEIIPKSNDV